METKYEERRVSGYKFIVTKLFLFVIFMIKYKAKNHATKIKYKSESHDFHVLSICSSIELEKLEMTY